MTGRATGCGVGLVSGHGPGPIPISLREADLMIVPSILARNAALCVLFVAPLAAQISFAPPWGGSPSFAFQRAACGRDGIGFLRRCTPNRLDRRVQPASRAEPRWRGQFPDPDDLQLVGERVLSRRCRRRIDGPSQLRCRGKRRIPAKHRRRAQFRRGDDSRHRSQSQDRGERGFVHIVYEANPPAQTASEIYITSSADGGQNFGPRSTSPNPRESCRASPTSTPRGHGCTSPGSSWALQRTSTSREVTTGVRASNPSPPHQTSTRVS